MERIAAAVRGSPPRRSVNGFATKTHSYPSAMVSIPYLTWQSFQTIPSAAEAALASDCCHFSLATLEIYTHPKTTCHAVVEEEEKDVWRWAIIDEECVTIEDGRAPSRERARQIAENLLCKIALSMANASA